MTVLVVAGGPADRNAFRALRFDTSRIRTSDEESQPTSSVPYESSSRTPRPRLSGRELRPDRRLAGLRGCRSPHGRCSSSTESPRRSARAQSRDGALIRAAGKPGGRRARARSSYSPRASLGGRRQQSTPNYVYRWSDREVKKTVASFAPHARHRVRFFRGFELPESLLEADSGAARARLLRLAAPDRRRPSSGSSPDRRTCSRSSLEKPRLPGRPAAVDARRGRRPAAGRGGRRPPLRDPQLDDPDVRCAV